MAKSPYDDPRAWNDDLRAWYERGDEAAVQRIVRFLSRYVAFPHGVVRVLGEQAVEELEQEVLLRLLDRNKRPLLKARNAPAYARKAAWNAAKDALDRHSGREGKGEHLPVEELPLRAPAGPGPVVLLDYERAVAALAALGEDARLAVYLVHAPERMPEEDWQLVRARQPPGEVPERPTAPLDRDEASRLLWPPPVPEPRAARRRRLERLRKVLERAYDRLRRLIGGA